MYSIPTSHNIEIINPKHIQKKYCTFRIKIENYLDLVTSVHPHHFKKILFILNTFISIHNNHFDSTTNKI